MYAPSTIAMTIYNLIGLAGKPVHVSVLRSQSERVQLPGMTDEMFEAGLEGLVKRGWAENNDDTIDLKDSNRRLVKRRDRSDGGFDDDGNPIGGWNGWLVQDGAALVSIDEATK